MEYIKVNKYPQTIKKLRKENISSFNLLNYEKLRELGIKEDTKFTFCDDKTNQLFQIWIEEERLESEEEVEKRVKKEESHNKDCDEYHRRMRTIYKQKKIIDYSYKSHIEVFIIDTFGVTTISNIMDYCGIKYDTPISLYVNGIDDVILEVKHNRLETEEEWINRNKEAINFNKKYDEYHNKYTLNGTVKI